MSCIVLLICVRVDSETQVVECFSSNSDFLLFYKQLISCLLSRGDKPMTREGKCLPPPSPSPHLNEALGISSGDHTKEVVTYIVMLAFFTTLSMAQWLQQCPRLTTLLKSPVIYKSNSLIANWMRTLHVFIDFQITQHLSLLMTYIYQEVQQYFLSSMDWVGSKWQQSDVKDVQMKTLSYSNVKYMYIPRVPLILHTV